MAGRNGECRLKLTIRLKANCQLDLLDLTDAISGALRTRYPELTGVRVTLADTPLDFDRDDERPVH